MYSYKPFLRINAEEIPYSCTFIAIIVQLYPISSEEIKCLKWGVLVLFEGDLRGFSYVFRRNTLFLYINVQLLVILVHLWAIIVHLSAFLPKK